MTENEYKSIDEAIDQAQESVVPFPVSTEDELSVVGDANKTEINKHDFKIEFLVPQQGKYTSYTKEFKGVYITPRQNVSIVKAVTALLPFFRKTNKGEVGEYTEAEKREIASKFDQSVYDVMYDMVSVVLNIDPELKDYMTPQTVMDATVKILLQYPEMVNEADTFFA